jgi:5-formyltetrahydrofolate cyclo-ligase
MGLDKVKRLLEESGTQNTIAHELMMASVKDANKQFMAAYAHIVGDPPLSPSAEDAEEALASVIIPLSLHLPFHLVMAIKRLVNRRQQPFVEILEELVRDSP